MLGKVVFGSVLVLAQSAALAEGHAIAAKVGALGLGVEYAYSLTDRVTFRAGLNGSEFGFDGEESGIDYDFDVVWDSLTVAVDFHPMNGAFRLTGGYMKNDNRLEGVSRPSGNTTIGDDTYTPEEVGTLTASAGFDESAPFAGVGWDWSRRRQRFGVSFDIGVVSQGSPEVTLTGSGTLLGDPAFQSDIQAEEAELSDSLEDLDLMPYATLGFVFRF